MGLVFLNPFAILMAPKKNIGTYQRPWENNRCSPKLSIQRNISVKQFYMQAVNLNQYARGGTSSLSERLNEYAKNLRHAYLASISYMDAQIGIDLGRIKSLLRVGQKTIIDDLGETLVAFWVYQRVWGKTYIGLKNALKSVDH